MAAGLAISDWCETILPGVRQFSKIGNRPAAPAPGGRGIPASAQLTLC
ncbi:UNVERIFIED_ORG: hypothetical protein M2312_005400 [Rhizobium esperanzae]|nr:hypothetical protein [Rhizobium esperanzae]